MKVDHSSDGQAVVVSLTGSFDGQSTLVVQTALSHLLDQGHHLFAVDCGHVHRLDRAGIWLLVSLNQRLLAGGGHLILFNLPAPIARVVELAGLSARLPVACSRTEALAELHAAGDARATASGGPSVLTRLTRRLLAAADAELPHWTARLSHTTTPSELTCLLAFLLDAEGPLSTGPLSERRCDAPVLSTSASPPAA